MKIVEALVVSAIKTASMIFGIILTCEVLNLEYHFLATCIVFSLLGMPMFLIEELDKEDNSED